MNSSTTRQPAVGLSLVQGADVLNTLSPDTINITRNGYLYIYLSNETQNWDVGATIRIQIQNLPDGTRVVMGPKTSKKELCYRNY